MYNCLEILVWFDAEHVAGSYEGEVYGGVACGLVAVDEEPVLASEGDGPDAALDDYALQHDFRFLSYGDSSLLIP